MPLDPANLTRRRVSVTSAPTGRARQALFALLLMAAAACGPAGSSDDETQISGSPERIQAVVLDARQPFGDSTLAAVRDLHATHVALVSFGFQESATTPAIRFSPDVRWYSESADGARAIAKRAKAHDLGIILKPQIWLRGGAWTADIDFADEKAWRAWESEYEAYLLQAADLAAEIDADLLIIGTELSTPVRKRPEFWRSLIADIRSRYDGALTYAANWYEDYEHVAFWDALDYIGVNAYFPMANGSDAAPADLRAAWARHAEHLQALAERVDRPVLFTELGYRSVGYAAEEPWRWPSRDEAQTVQPDYELQSRLFEAFFDTVWMEPWFGGAVIWKMYPRVEEERHALDFTPQGKPAEEVIRRGFAPRR